MKMTLTYSANEVQGFIIQCRFKGRNNNLMRPFARDITQKRQPLKEAILKT